MVKGSWLFDVDSNASICNHHELAESFAFWLDQLTHIVVDSDMAVDNKWIHEAIFTPVEKMSEIVSKVFE